MRFFAASLFVLFTMGVADALEPPRVVVSNVRRVFDNGEHNAFTDLIKFSGRYYLTFRSCPDGHMVHSSASIIVLASEDLQQWEQVHQFQVPLRDTRDPHFLEFKGQLFVMTGTWYCGEKSPKPSEYDLNQHLGYAVYSQDGSDWSAPTMLEGTFGHYIWRASSAGGKAYLCGRRKHEFDIRPRGEGPDVESAMLESDDGLVWRTHSLFQEKQGDETAFQFELDGRALAIARRGRDNAELLTSVAPYTDWKHRDLDFYIGGPLLARWADRWVVGGRKNTARGPKTVMHWLDDGDLIEFAELPSGGDNSYPGFVALGPSNAVMSWYSSHEVDDSGKPITAIYLADLKVAVAAEKVERNKISFQSTHDGTLQQAYASGPARFVSAERPPLKADLVPMVVSLHSWSSDLEQRQPELEALVAERGWICLQPNFRGVNDGPDACGSLAAQQDIIDSVRWAIANYPVDPNRIYLTGNSGGGHMTLLMAARFPEQWAAASAWVGISDLVAWHKLHREGKYGEMVRACCGGAPGGSTEIDAQYQTRSPLFFLRNAVDVPLDIATGIHDGHTGSVPVRHSLDAFNVIAASVGSALISEAEIAQLSVDDGRLAQPQPNDMGFDPTFQRDFYLRRTANMARVTVFEGGHEGIATAAMAWFDKHPTRTKSE